jgi:hypothetical protein
MIYYCAAKTMNHSKGDDRSDVEELPVGPEFVLCMTVRSPNVGHDTGVKKWLKMAVSSHLRKVNKPCQAARQYKR